MPSDSVPKIQNAHDLLFENGMIRTPGPEGFPVDRVLVADLIRTVKGNVTGVTIGVTAGCVIWLLHETKFGLPFVW